MPKQKPALKIALIGHGFMGAAHSQGWRVAPRFFDLPLQPEMTLLVGRQAAGVEAAAEKWGWAETSTDWRTAIERDDIDVVDIVTPGNSHAEIAIAALAAGKHVLCEKPLANTLAESEAMTAAARSAGSGIKAMVGFTYRRVPAATFARELVTSGAIGEVRQVRAAYLQDWLYDASSPLTWRLQKEHAGTGALGDIGAHAVDLSQFITGQKIVGVSGLMQTFVYERPLLEDPSQHGEVSVDDAAAFTARFDGGALGTFEATRMATGRKNSLRIEVSGSKGAISFDLENYNSLGYYDATAVSTRQGFAQIMVTEEQHPYISAWWPTGHTLGYEHGFVHQAKDFIEAIGEGQQPTPSFEDGHQVQRVLDAVQQSAANDSIWTAAA